MNIVIDPGHGFCRDSQAVWGYDRPEWYGVREDLLVSYIAKSLHDVLQGDGIIPILTRPLPETEEGEEIGLSGQPRWKESALYWARANWAGHMAYSERGSNDRNRCINSRPWLVNFRQPSMAVSLHVNASDHNHQAHGTEVWHRPGDRASRRLAELVYSELVKDERFDGSRGVRGDNDWEVTHAKQLAWFRQTDDGIPTILVEFLFFSNKGDAALLSDVENLYQAGEAIYRGVMRFAEEEGMQQ